MKKKVSKSKPISVKAWTVIVDDIPMFMGAFDIDQHGDMEAKNKSEILVGHFRALYPGSKLKVGKVTLVHGWK